MKTINNIDKPLEIAPTVDEAIKKAEKDFEKNNFGKIKK